MVFPHWAKSTIKRTIRSHRRLKHGEESREKRDGGMEEIELDNWIV